MSGGETDSGFWEFHQKGVACGLHEPSRNLRVTKSRGCKTRKKAIDGEVIDGDDELRDHRLREVISLQTQLQCGRFQ